MNRCARVQQCECRACSCEALLVSEGILSVFYVVIKLLSVSVCTLLPSAAYVSHLCVCVCSYNGVLM